MAQWSLLELHAGQFTVEGQEAVKSAAAAAVTCAPLVEVFEELLRQVTLRRLHVAQDAALEALATSP